MKELKMSKFAPAALAVLVSFAPAAALADYAYNFVVPVTAKQLPAGSAVQILCKLFPGPNGTGDALTYFSSQAAAATNAAFSGNLTAGGTSATAAASYTCQLFVIQNGKAISVDDSRPSGLATGWTGITRTRAVNF